MLASTLFLVLYILIWYVWFFHIYIDVCVFVMVYDFSQANKTKAWTFVDFIISLSFPIRSFSIFRGSFFDWFHMFGMFDFWISCEKNQFIIIFYPQLSCLLILHVYHLVCFFGVLIYRKTECYFCLWTIFDDACPSFISFFWLCNLLQHKLCMDVHVCHYSHVYQWIHFCFIFEFLQDNKTKA